MKWKKLVSDIKKVTPREWTIYITAVIIILIIIFSLIITLVTDYSNSIISANINQSNYILWWLISILGVVILFTLLSLMFIFTVKTNIRRKKFKGSYRISILLTYLFAYSLLIFFFFPHAFDQLRDILLTDAKTTYTGSCIGESYIAYGRRRPRVETILHIDTESRPLKIDEDILSRFTDIFPAPKYSPCIYKVKVTYLKYSRQSLNIEKL